MTVAPRILRNGILRAGLLAGTLDGLAACILYYMATQKDPSRVFLYIASGAFGKGVYEWGVGGVVAGLLFHYSFAMGWSILYFLSFDRLKLKRVHPFIAGIVYGCIVWAGMNLVVIPLSTLAPQAFDIAKAAQAAGILIVCVGIPIAFFARSTFVFRSSIETADRPTP